MSVPIHVPDFPSPTAELCWRQGHHTMVRCDRVANHAGPHSWEMAAELERLREQCEHPEDFCGCTMNRTGEEMTATCEWHTYPTTFAEKSATMAALAALREQLEKKDV